MSLSHHVEEAAVDHAVESVPTNAMTRGLSHLDVTKWCLMVGITAALRTALQHPFVVAMTRKQSMRETSGGMQVLKEMYKAHGIRSFFRGYFALATGIVFSEVYYMYLFESLRESLPVQSSTVKDGLAGLVSDTTSTFLQVPFVVISNRQMTAGHGLSSSTRYEASPYMVRRIVRESGWKGMWSGLGMSLMLAPHSGFWWALYGVMKQWMYDLADPLLNRIQSMNLHHLLKSKEDNIIVNSTAGFFSSVVVMTMYNPVIVMRTRWQVMDTIPKGTKNVFLYIAKDLYKHEGWRGFFKGTVLNVSTSSFDGLLFALLYELTKQYSDVTKD